VVSSFRHAQTTFSRTITYEDRQGRDKQPQDHSRHLHLNSKKRTKKRIQPGGVMSESS
jgi:hypothetical protein